MKIETATFYKTPAEMEAIRLKRRLTVVLSGIPKEGQLAHTIGFLLAESARIHSNPNSLPREKAFAEIVDSVASELIEDDYQEIFHYAEN